MSAAFQLNNAHDPAQPQSNTSVLPGVGAEPAVYRASSTPFPTASTFGLPFFYGRSIYTAIEGRTAGGVAGPFFAY